MTRKKKGRESPKTTKPPPHHGAKTILVLPDPHAHYLDATTDRATWAGRLAADLKPEIIVEMGDLADMLSLFAFDQPGRNHTTAQIGPTYKADCDGANNSLHHRKPLARPGSLAPSP